MANATTPMFCLPYVITSGDYFTIHLTDSSTGTHSVDVPLVAGTYYNNRDFTRSDNLLKHFVDQANLAETEDEDLDEGTWSVTEYASGNMKGMITLTRTAGHANDNLNNITFTQTTVIAGQDFGFTSNVVTPTSEVVGTSATWSSSYVTGRQWITHPVYPGTFLAHHEAMPRDFIVSIDPTVTAATQLTQDYYGTKTFRRIHIMTVNAASMLDQFAGDSDFLESGQTVSDPNVTWDSFRRTWRDASGDLKTCRFHPDMDTAATYHEVLPMMPWIASPHDGMTVAFEAPYRFDFDIEALDV